MARTLQALPAGAPYPVAYNIQLDFLLYIVITSPCKSFVICLHQGTPEIVSIEEVKKRDERTY